MAQRTLMLRHYVLEPGTAQAFIDWWSAHIPRLRERAGFTIEWAHLDREHDQFTWALTHPGSEADVRAAELIYERSEERAAAIATAPPLRGLTISYPEQVR